MLIAEAKRYLKEISEFREMLTAAAEARRLMEAKGLPYATETEEAAVELVGRKVADAVRRILELPPDEARVLLARYINGTPYALLSEDELLAGMTQRTAERLLARAVERFAENWRKAAA